MKQKTLSDPVALAAVALCLKGRVRRNQGGYWEALVGEHWVRDTMRVQQYVLDARGWIPPGEEWDRVRGQLGNSSQPYLVMRLLGAHGYLDARGVVCALTHDGNPGTTES